MNRLLPLAAALATSVLLLGATPGHAAPLGYYAATPAVPAVKTSVMTHSTPWQLENGIYVADRAPERAEVLCQLVAGRVGTLSGFSAGGVAFDADALAKCNAHAKPAASPVSVAAR